MDAIAVLEGFLRKYPSDRKWTPDVMFRLADPPRSTMRKRGRIPGGQEIYQKALDFGPSTHHALAQA